MSPMEPDSDHERAAAPLPWEGQPYSVKRYGVTITNCDSEPVHTPGCIQAHGALLVVRASDLTIVQVSENTAAILGHTPQALIGRPLATAIGMHEEAELRASLAMEAIDRNPIYVLTVPARGGSQPLDVTVHTIGAMALIELEATGRTEGDEPDYYGLVRQAAARLQATESIFGLCSVLCDEMRALTGLDRVMVYKFHADGHGEVFAESKRADLPPWLGLHYPADDIPKPARAIFKKLWVRPVPDIDDELAELVPLANPDTGKPLDLTHCALRGPSVMYTEYLRNMGVKASLTMSLRQEAELWGLIACHHYQGPKQVPHQVRAACEFVAQVASLQLQLAQEREQTAHRVRLETIHNQLVSHAAQAGDLAALMDATSALLDGLSATGAALCHRDQWWTVGSTPTETQLDALADWLSTRSEWTAPERPLYVTDWLVREYPAGIAYSDIASGMLAFPLARAQRSLMVWFRPETIRTVRWGGNPRDKPTVPGPHGPRLTPRVSFELFRESVRQRSLPWLPVEVDAAARLRLLVMELLVSRAEQLADLHANLARSTEQELSAFARAADHDIREPLRDIHAYAHQLLEDALALDEEHRRKLEALLRLTRRMDSLLDSLSCFSGAGRAVLQLQDVDLGEVLAEAMERVGGRTIGEQTEVILPRPLPRARCDRAQVREVFVDLLSIALGHHELPRPRIEVGFIAPKESHPRPGSPEGAAMQVIYYVRGGRLDVSAEPPDAAGTGEPRSHGGAPHGVELPLVETLVERHGGQVWLDSAPDRGTTVFFTLPCEGLPE